MKVSELKQISDILEAKEIDLVNREVIVADKEKTLKMAYKEFKKLSDKLYGKPELKKR